MGLQQPAVIHHNSNTLYRLHLLQLSLAVHVLNFLKRRRKDDEFIDIDVAAQMAAETELQFSQRESQSQLLELHNMKLLLPGNG
jgi:hypothetical protein